jgi:hypothetical protein
MPDAEDRRALLNAMAFGDDPQLTPSDRLRALELLEDLDAREPRRPDFYDEVAQIPEDELERQMDAYANYDEAEIRALVDGSSTRQPNLAAAIHAEVERRTRGQPPGD